MDKIAMGEVNEDVLLDLVISTEVVNIPKKVIVVDYKNGTYKDKDDIDIPWANFIVNDFDEVAKLKQVGLESIASKITLKLSNYDGRDLEEYKGKNLGTEKFDVVFQTRNSRFGSSINGVAFKVEFLEVL